MLHQHKLPWVGSDQQRASQSSERASKPVADMLPNIRIFFDRTLIVVYYAGQRHSRGQTPLERHLALKSWSICSTHILPQIIFFYRPPLREMRLASLPEGDSPVKRQQTL